MSTYSKPIWALNHSGGECDLPNVEFKDTGHINWVSRLEKLRCKSREEAANQYFLIAPIQQMRTPTVSSSLSSIKFGTVVVQLPNRFALWNFKTSNIATALASMLRAQAHQAHKLSE